VRISIEGAAALLRRALRLRPRLDLASLPHYPLLEHVVLHVVLLLLRVLRVLRLLRLMRPMRPHLPQPMLRLLMQGGRSRPFLFRLLLLLPVVSNEVGSATLETVVGFWRQRLGVHGPISLLGSDTSPRGDESALRRDDSQARALL
jgi:hypothetical protein